MTLTIRDLQVAYDDVPAVRQRSAMAAVLAWVLPILGGLAVGVLLAVQVFGPPGGTSKSAPTMVGAQGPDSGTTRGRCRSDFCRPPRTKERASVLSQKFAAFENRLEWCSYMGYVVSLRSVGSVLSNLLDSTHLSCCPTTRPRPLEIIPT